MSFLKWIQIFTFWSAGHRWKHISTILGMLIFWLGIKTSIHLIYVVLLVHLKFMQLTHVNLGMALFLVEIVINYIPLSKLWLMEYNMAWTQMHFPLTVGDLCISTARIVVCWICIIFSVASTCLNKDTVGILKSQSIYMNGADVRSRLLTINNS